MRYFPPTHPFLLFSRVDGDTNSSLLFWSSHIPCYSKCWCFTPSSTISKAPLREFGYLPPRDDARRHEQCHHGLHRCISTFGSAGFPYKLQNLRHVRGNCFRLTFAFAYAQMSAFRLAASCHRPSRGTPLRLIVRSNMSVPCCSWCVGMCERCAGSNSLPVYVCMYCMQI